MFDNAEPTIALRPSAVFQLLLFGATEGVRDAAAGLLEPSASVPASHLRLLRGSFPSMPKCQQIAARLVATAMVRFPSDAERFLGLYPDWAELSSTAECVFVHETPMCDPSTARIDGVFETYTWRRAAFRLPKAVDQTVEKLHTGRKRRSGRCSVHAARWLIEAGALHVAFQVGCRDFRGTKHWRPMRIYSPEGVLLKEAKDPGGFSWPLDGVKLDLGLLMRLEAGALEGHVIDFWFEQPYRRPDRARNCVVSVECGASLSDPPVVVTLVGDFEPRYPIDAIVGKPTLAMPLLGGETLASLDLIARRVGVWHGSHLRGSFAYHPLRTAVRQEAA